MKTSLTLTANPPFIHEVDASVCAVCASSGLSNVVAQGLDFEYETCANVWKVCECPQCGHLQLNPRPATSTLSVIYPGNYYSYQMGKVSPFALWCKRKLDKRKFAGILKMLGKQPSSYLDVGCGDGRYLELMIAMGLGPANVHGIEIDQDTVDVARSKGLNVVNCRAEEAEHLADGSLDLITMFHVIEHLDEPGKVIQTLARKLKPGGMLIMETPNFDSLDARMFGRRYWGGFHFPRHWHIFKEPTLARLAQTHGLHAQATRYQPGHAFWLFSFHHLLRYGWGTRRLANAFHPLKSLPGLALVVAFDLARAALGMKTSAMLMACRKGSQKADGA